MVKIKNSGLPKFGNPLFFNHKHMAPNYQESNMDQPLGLEFEPGQASVESKIRLVATLELGFQ
jgi:hypothetical protein